MGKFPEVENWSTVEELEAIRRTPKKPAIPARLTDLKLGKGGPFR